MSTPHVPLFHPRRLHISTWLLAGVALTAVLLAVGGWRLLDRDAAGTSAGGASPATVAAVAAACERDPATVIDRLTCSWSAGDTDAAAAQYGGAVFVTASGHRYLFWGDVLEPKPLGYPLGAPAASDGVAAARIAPVVAEGNVQTTFLEYATRDGKHGTLLTVLEFGPTAVVLRQWEFELGVTPPFDILRVPVERAAGSGAEAAKVIDALTTAATAGDADAIAALYTDDAVFATAHGDRVVGVEDVTNVVTTPSAVGIQIKRIAPITTAGAVVATFVAYSGPVHGTKLSVFELEDGKIARHWDFELGMTPPLDNAFRP